MRATPRSDVAFASSTVTGTPWRTRLAAATIPTGPAPAISTLSRIVMRVRAPAAYFGSIPAFSMIAFHLRSRKR